MRQYVKHIFKKIETTYYYVCNFAKLMRLQNAIEFFKTILSISLQQSIFLLFRVLKYENKAIEE